MKCAKIHPKMKGIVKEHKRELSMVSVFEEKEPNRFYCSLQGKPSTRIETKKIHIPSTRRMEWSFPTQVVTLFVNVCLGSGVRLCNLLSFVFIGGNFILYISLILVC